MELKYAQKIAEKLSLTLKQISNVQQLHSEGATIPFIARYRKEATNNLDEVAITNIVEEINYFTELEKRKRPLLKPSKVW
jgi:Transcriptional accessory protein